MALAKINYYKLKKNIWSTIKRPIGCHAFILFSSSSSGFDYTKNNFSYCVRILNDWKAESLDVEPGTNTKWISNNFNTI